MVRFLICGFIIFLRNYISYVVIFQVRLYRFSLSNIQTYDNNTNINNPPNIHLPYPSSNEHYKLFNGYNSDYVTPGQFVPEKYSNFDTNRCNRALSNERHRQYSSATSPNRDRYSFPYEITSTTDIDPSKRQSYPKPFRSSSSAGAILGHLNNTTELSPSIEYSRKQFQPLRKGQYYEQGVEVYNSMPTMNSNNNATVERRNRVQGIVVG